MPVKKRVMAVTGRDLYPISVICMRIFCLSNGGLKVHFTVSFRNIK
jgi:hypothetical protein